MSQPTRRVLIIVPAAQQAAANAALQALNGGDTFSCPLVPASQGKGLPPVTHYACEWQMTEAERTAVQAALSGIPHRWADRSHWDPFAGTPTVSQELTAAGLKRYEPNL